MNHVVWPYSSGEVIVQNYNAVLSLSRLARASDGVLIVENDAVHEVCSRMLGTKHVSTDAINGEIARHLAGE
jgi:tubulin delta